MLLLSERDTCMIYTQETPRYDMKIKRNETLRWAVKFKNKQTGIYEDFTGSSFTLHVEPRDDSPAFTITTAGPAEQKLLVELNPGKVTTLIAVANINAFTWDAAEYRLEQVDSLGDTRVRLAGVWQFETEWAEE